MIDVLDALQSIASDNGGTRASGTPGYDVSADYVAYQLEALGFEVARQTVEFTFFREAAPVSLSVGETDWSGIEWLHALVYSADGDVSGLLQTVGIDDGVATETAACDGADWATFEPGRIALVVGAVCRRRDVVELAQTFGAAALISMYPAWGANETRQPTLLDPDGIVIPTIAVGGEPSAALLDAAAAGTEVVLTVDVEMYSRLADNVIGERRGTGDSVVMLGGHLDSVLDGPGINDNGSGVATLLSLAASVAVQPEPQKTIRFAFWAVEELGTHGSSAYVDSLSPAERVRSRRT